MKETISLAAKNLGTKYLVRRDSIRDRRLLNATWQLIVFVFGVSLLGLGLFFIIFPGPGWATILLALIVLGSEFTWANRLLHPVRNFTSTLATKILSDEYQQRRMHFLLGATFLAVALSYIYWSIWGASLDGLRLVRSILIR